VTLQTLPHRLAERSVYFGASETLQEAGLSLVALPKHFVLLLAANTTPLSGPELVDAARRILEAGASYVCCWGPGCERLHDCFDEARFGFDDPDAGDDVIMTTWHEDESLEEAIWFAINTAFPTPKYEVTTRIVAVLTIANASWSLRAEEYLREGAPSGNEA